MTFKTRFAPSPTGPLHLGHAYSALLTQDMAARHGSELVLRIEDTDYGRCKPTFETAIFEDLAWLGIRWPLPVMRQSERIPAYDLALKKLIENGYCFPCNCSRRDIREALSAPQERVPCPGDKTVSVYPGTCRNRTMASRTDNDAIRLNMEKVVAANPEVLQHQFVETGSDHAGRHGLTKSRLFREIGDVVLARRDIRAASYHLSVVVDDAAQDISHIIRGQDLFEATFIHILLQKLLKLPTPVYHHHALIRDSEGRRLAKRDDARAINTFREQGHSPLDIRKMVGL